MDFTTEFTKIKELLDKSTEVLIVTHERPTFDSIGSTLAIGLGLSGLGKKVLVACQDQMTVDLSSFIGVNKIVNDLSKKNFIISLDYVDGSIEKVSYNIEGNKFNLVIEPRPGFPSFSPDKVHYSYGGGASDLIIVVDTIQLGGLGALYEENKELFSAKPVLNIDHHPNNTQYGQYNVVDPQASSTSELAAQLLSYLGVALTTDIATNLLNALYGATDNFTSLAVSASAFEVAAVCARAGAKRFSRPVVEEEVPSGEAARGSAVRQVGRPAKAKVQPNSSAAAVPPQSGSEQTGQAPADWLKPKIFKSSNPI